MAPEELFLSQLPLIERAARWACRRSHFSREEVEDFVSTVKLKLIADDYAVIRKFKERSKLSTYLTVCIQRQFQDYLNQLWGKWRASAEALRLGDLPVKLEELVGRDRLSFPEACEVLIQSSKVEVSREELERIWARLPQKLQRRWEGEEALRDLPAREEPPQARVLERELRGEKDRVRGILNQAVAALSDDDRLILKMRVEEDRQIADIARALGLEQKPLYRRMERILKNLRDALEREGVDGEQVATLLGWRE